MTAKADMTPIERFIVVLAGYASPREIRRLRQFFQQWEKQNPEPKATA